MTRHAFLPTMLLTLAAGPASADLSARAVWENWQATASVYGEGITAAEIEEAPGGLILRGVQSRWAPYEGARLIASIAEVRITERDGAVTIDFPRTIAVTYAAGAEDGGATEAEGVLRLEGADMRASGLPGAITYRYDIARLDFDVTGTSTAAGTRMENTVGGTVMGMTGVYAGLPGTAAAPAEIGVAATSVEADSTSLADGMTTRIAGRYEDVSLGGTLAPNPDGPLPLLLDLETRTGATTQQTVAATPDGPVRYRTQAAGTETVLRLDASGFEATLRGRETQALLDLGALPMALPPLSFTLGEAELGIALPLDLSRGARPFRFRADFGPFTADDAVWAQFDPDGHLDRAPGRLAFDVTGTLTEAVEAPFADLLPERLDIESFELALGGARLNGAGGFDFAFDPGSGQPAPEGTLRVALEGGLELIGRLAAAGILPQEQVMGAQMMLGMMAVRDGNADRLVSVIETGPGMRLTVNGMQLR